MSRRTRENVVFWSVMALLLVALSWAGGNDIEDAEQTPAIAKRAS